MEPTLGSRLRQERMAKGLSIAALASALQYTRAHLSAIELSTSRPSRSVVEGYERELGLPLGTLTDLFDQSANGNGGQAMERILTAIRDGLANQMTAARQPVVPRKSQKRPMLPKRTHGDIDVVRGADQIFSRAVETLDNAITVLPAPHQPILVTYQASIGSRRDSLRQAIRKGWRVEVGYRLAPRDDEARLALVEGMLSVAAESGSQFAAYALDPKIGGFDAIVIPNHCAMLFFSTGGSTYDEAWILDASHQRDRVGSVYNHLRYQLQQGRPILKVYDYQQARPDRDVEGIPDAPLNRLRFNALLRSPDGDRYLLKNGPSLMRLMPAAIDEARAERLLASRGPSWFEFALALRDQREQQLAAFRDQLDRGIKFYDLIGKPGVDELVEHGRIRDDWLAEAFSPVERLRYLESIIEALRHEHYQIALLEDDPDIFYYVAGRQSDGVVFFEAFSADEAESREFDIEVREPALATVARKHFMHLWEQVPPLNREKASVITYFQGKLDDLKKRYPTDLLYMDREGH